MHLTSYNHFFYYHVPSCVMHMLNGNGTGKALCPLSLVLKLNPSLSNDNGCGDAPIITAIVHNDTNEKEKNYPPKPSFV